MRFLLKLCPFTNSGLPNARNGVSFRRRGCRDWSRIRRLVDRRGAFVASVQDDPGAEAYLRRHQGANIVSAAVTGKEGRTEPPAAGRFGIPAAGGAEPRTYRPAGCPSPEQFEERFRLADALLQQSAKTPDGFGLTLPSAPHRR